MIDEWIEQWSQRRRRADAAATTKKAAAAKKAATKTAKKAAAKKPPAVRKTTTRRPRPRRRRATPSSDAIGANPARRYGSAGSRALGTLRPPAPLESRHGRRPAPCRAAYASATASGSVATGAFGTVPGPDAAALPHRQPRHRGAVGGRDRLPPKAWDVVLNPVAGRVSDRTVDPRGPRRPWLLRAGLMLAAAFALIFAAPDLDCRSLEAGWVLVFFVAAASAYAFFQVPYVAMPAEITVVVRRAHPADDLAGRDPGLHDHAGRRDRAGDPRRGRRPGRLPRDGRRDGACSSSSASSRA